MITMERLKPKEQLFCYYYAKLRNCKEATIKAGFPKQTAEKQGDKLLMKQSVLKLINYFSVDMQSNELMQSIVSGLKRLAFSSTNDSVQLLYTSKDDLPKILDELDLFHVSEIKMPKENAIEIKFFDRFKAFDKLIELIEKRSDQMQANDFFAALEQSATLDTNNGEQDEV